MTLPKKQGRDPVVQTNFNMRRSLRRRAHVFCRENGIALGHLLRELLRGVLDGTIKWRKP